ncbi:MAG: glycosyltransferase family 4 protein [Bacteroidales bacterium]|nr:glycosyltransferase family 4 protein [Bacteroidales bacterium]MCF8391444.1 glycosyltransferase family 4 protein [Bacteroidales bacterium]
MKILILSSKVPFPKKDGGAIATISLAESLADEGNEISMLCLNTKKHFFNINDIPQSLRKKIHFMSVDINTGINPLQLLANFLFSKEPYNARRFYSNEYEILLKKILENEKPDFVQLEGPYMGYYIPVIRKFSKAKISLRAHNVENEIWKLKYLRTRNFFVRFYLKNLSLRIEKLESKIVLSSDFLVSISENDRKNLIKFSDIPSITIQTGLSPENYPPPKQGKFPSLFFIGALDWTPNQEGIIWFIEEVFLNLRKKLPKIEFHVAGRNAPEWLSKRMDAHKDNGVIYHGEVENAYEFMNKYAIFISPLFTGSGIRIKILEGMIMQRVVIATGIAIEGINATHLKNCIITDEAEEMKNIIFELCNNKEKYNQIAASARQFILENFNNLASGKKLSDFYRSYQP